MNNEKISRYMEFLFEPFTECDTDKSVSLEEIRLNARNQWNREEQREIEIIIDLLQDNGYLEIDKASGLIKLTSKGYEHIHENTQLKLRISLQPLVMPTGNLRNPLPKDYIFNELWRLIGKQNEALFYIKGPSYYNRIKGFIKGSYPSYSDYIKHRKKEQKLSDSRKDWYRDLFNELPKDKVLDFIDDLSQEINSEIENNTTPPKELPLPDPFNDPFEEDEINSCVEGNTRYLMKTTIDTFGSQISISDDCPKIKNEEPTKQVEPFIQGTCIDEERIFISYAWEKSHESTIIKIRERLKEAGFKIDFDKDQPLGTHIGRYMNQGIERCRKCLICITPEYSRKAESDRGGVANETLRIEESMRLNQSTTRFIPLLLEGNFETTPPNFLRDRKGIDFVNRDFEDAMKELIKELKS